MFVTDHEEDEISIICLKESAILVTIAALFEAPLKVLVALV